MGFLDNLRTASAPVYLLVMMFAMSTWIDIVGIWVEMPLMVNVLPEAWALPAYLTVTIQCANVGPAIYAIVDKIRANRRGVAATTAARRGNCDGEIAVTFGIIATAATSMFVMSFVWTTTVFVFGAWRSVPFIALVLCTALVSCMSSVVFLPYMARFKPVYIAAYYIGQGLCGLVPGLVGLAQGVGRAPDCVNATRINNDTGSYDNQTYVSAVYPPPHFSVDAFLRFLAVCLCLSGAAFYLLNFTRFCRREMVGEVTQTATNESTRNGTKNEMKESDADGAKESRNDSREGEQNGLLQQSERPAPTVQVVNSALATDNPMDMLRYVALLVMIGIVSAMSNGILPATQTYTCLPFGSVVYALAVRLSSVAGPLATLSSMFLKRPTVKVVGGLTGGAAAIGVFHLVLAGQSPDPWLKGTLVGAIVIVASSVVNSALNAFVRVSVASILRVEGSRGALLWCGIVTQLGSFCGAVVTFVLVSVLHIFRSAPKPCT